MKIRNVRLSGGPWDRRFVRVAKPGNNYRAGTGRESLRIRVAEHVGRYDLLTGAWLPDDPQP